MRVPAEQRSSVTTGDELWVQEVGIAVCQLRYRAEPNEANSPLDELFSRRGCSFEPYRVSICGKDRSNFAMTRFVRFGLKAAVPGSHASVRFG